MSKLLNKSILIIFVVLFLDQLLKIWIKTHLILGQEIHIFDGWFILHFTENEGMAFGMKLGGSFGKLILSIFRIIAVAAIGWYLLKLIREKAKTSLVICLSLIFAGALGNIIDSAFYGLIFNESYFHISPIFAKDGGYASFLHGKVVDMLYFPLIEGHFPNWFPFWGGEDFIFFRPVFNLADSSISIGVFSLVLFQRQLFSKTVPKIEEGTIAEESSAADVEDSH